MEHCCYLNLTAYKVVCTWQLIEFYLSTFGVLLLFLPGIYGVSLCFVTDNLWNFSRQINGIVVLFVLDILWNIRWHLMEHYIAFWYLTAYGIAFVYTIFCDRLGRNQVMQKLLRKHNRLDHFSNKKSMQRFYTVVDAMKKLWTSFHL